MHAGFTAKCEFVTEGPYDAVQVESFHHMTKGEVSCSEFVQVLPVCKGIAVFFVSLGCD